MKIAVQTSLLPGADLAAQFANAARYGFDAVEVPVGPSFDLTDRFDEVRQASASSGLPVAAICTHSIHDPLVPEMDERERRFMALSDLLRMADELGAGGVVSVPVRRPHVFPGPQDPPGEPVEVAAAPLRDWAGTLPPGQARLFLEPLNRYEAWFLRRVEQAVALAERVDHPRVVALADLFHMNIEETSLAAPLTAAGDRLGHVHIADNTRLLPGHGFLDFVTPFQALKAIDYRGYLALECAVPPGSDPAVALPETARFLRERWATT